MLASRLPGLLPPLTDQAALETTRIHSAAGLGLPPAGLVRQPPFRAPHHGASSVALVGGGSATMRPGEISAACNGVLFLDELAEFAGHVLDALRQPLEEGVVRVARAAATVTFPARFLLVAAMNPCPCGYGGRPGGCRCSDAARARYHRRLSGPLLDRFDLRVEVTRPSVSDLMGHGRCEPTAAVRSRVLAARAIAAARGIETNAAIPVDRLDELAPLAPEAGEVLAQALRSGRLSARGLHRVRRVARTVADLQGAAGALTAVPRRDGAQPAGRCRTGDARPGPVGMTDERDLGFSALLAGHAAVGPRRLRELLSEGSAEAGWIAMGGDPRVDPLPVAGALHAAGVEMLVEGGPGYPDRLARLPGSSGPPVRPRRPHGARAPPCRDRGHAPVHRERRRVRP